MKLNIILFNLTIFVCLKNKCTSAQNNNSDKEEEEEGNKPNNVCSTYEDYFRINTSKNCWYNPDIDKNEEEIILSKGYPLEKYVVTTEDGYLLDLYRLPRKEDNKGIVFLQHPASADFSCWVVFGKNNSFAFVLYDAGYDVWMGNARGTEHGRRHVNLSPDDKKFWDFSYHEIGIYDMPAFINFIRLKTNYKKKITAIGHSMGGTTLIIYATMLPKHVKDNVNLIVPISPAIQFKYIRSHSIKFITTIFTEDLMKLFEDVGFVEVLRRDGPLHSLKKILCNVFPISHIVCFGIDAFSSGMSYENAPEFQPIAHTFTPFGLSLKTLFHFVQSIRSTKFDLFDYGRIKNLELYGQETPPEYPLKNISVPLFLVFGGEDTIITAKDTKEVYNDLPEIAKQYGYLEVKKANHFDTIYSKYIRQNIQEPVIKLIEKINTL